MVDGPTLSIVEVVRRRHGGRTLQELRGAMTRFARSRALGRIAADLGLQFQEVGENIRLAPQFVGNYRWLAGNGRNHGDVDAAALNRLHQRAEVTVAGKQHHLVNVTCEFHGIDGKLDVHVALHLASTKGIDEFLGRLGDDRIAIIIEPVDQRADRRAFLIFDDCRVVKRAQQRSATLEFLEQALVIDVETERLGRRVEIGAIDEQCNLV
jgi:hypothetical protein